AAGPRHADPPGQADRGELTRRASAEPLAKEDAREAALFGAAGFLIAEPRVERGALVHPLVGVETYLIIAAAAGLALGEVDQPAAKAATLKIRRHGDVGEKEMVGFRLQNDDASDRAARRQHPHRVLPDALPIIVEQRARLLADAVDIFGVGVAHDVLHRWQIDDRGRSDDGLAHRGAPPPQVGQSGSFGSLTRWKLAPSASYISSVPDRLSPMPRSSFRTSTACRVPMTPATAPRMPAVSQRGTRSGGGASRKRQR